jgi:hypothetical protein
MSYSIINDLTINDSIINDSTINDSIKNDLTINDSIKNDSIKNDSIKNDSNLNNIKNIYIDDINDINDINAFFTQSKNNSCLNSWAELINSKVDDNIIDKEILIKNSTKKDDNKKELQLNVIEIMALNINELSDILLLEYQTYIASQLRKYFKQCLDKNENIDYDLHLSKVKWLSEVTKYFCDKNKLKYSLHKVKITVDTNNLPRSSYKFCEFGAECQYNYGEKKKCHSLHFVHNIIYADIISLYQYLLIGQSYKQKLDLNEITKSINTISFVINHMYEEINSINSCIPNQNKKIFKKNKKNTFTNVSK